MKELIWTKKPPTKTGWYLIDWLDDVVSVVFCENGWMTHNGTGYSLRYVEGAKFAGPIPKPKGKDVFETERDTQEFKMIKANFLAVVAYAKEMGGE